jgi:sirohydrochlorin ferrochelatase
VDAYHATIDIMSEIGQADARLGEIQMNAGKSKATTEHV